MAGRIGGAGNSLRLCHSRVCQAGTPGRLPSGTADSGPSASLRPKRRGILGPPATCSGAPAHTSRLQTVSLSHDLDGL